MHRLHTDKRVQILSMLCEGASMRSVSRLADVSINTVAKPLVDAGLVCAAFHDENVRGLKSKRVQCDEIWAFVGAKNKNATPEQKAEGWDDCWTWTAIDADSKVLVSYRVGHRTMFDCYEFMKDVASRLASKVQLTTDGLTWYRRCAYGRRLVQRNQAIAGARRDDYSISQGFGMKSSSNSRTA